jgi:methyl-accepting chemotaxis protein
MGAKVITLFLIAGLVPFGITGVLSYNSASTSLKQQAFNQLISVRETKKKQIEDYFSTIRKQVQTFSGNRMIIDAMKEYKVAFKDFQAENRIEAAQLEEQRTALKTYYTEDFTEEYKNQNNGKRPDVVSYFNQLDNDSIALQYTYIKANNSPLGSKHELDAADDSSTYSKLHATYHPPIRDFLEQFGYYDIFLVDPDSGDIVYSVFKELDYTTSLKDGPYAGTNFGRVFKAANESSDPGYANLIDFDPYPPSYEGAASFIASPIFEGSEKVGVLIFQMPIDKINDVMTSGNDWKDVGLGDSGETYLIGDDLAMRSQSRFLIEDKEGYYAMMNSLGMDQDTLNKIKAKESTIGLQKVETKGTRAAVSGQTNVEIFPDYRDVPVLSAYAPLSIEDVHWVIMSEIDEAEALSPATALAKNLMKVAGAMVGLIVGIGFIVTRVTGKVTDVIKKMIRSLTDCSEQITSASGEVSESSQALAQGSSEQASSLEETSSSMEQMASITRQNANNAEEAAKLVDMCSISAENGNKAVKDMNVSMEEINGSSKKIAEIIKVIDGIAFQTNLLALNAAVEAARAGEHGKGFAVVAEEVRNLAQRSATAAKDTQTLIEDSVAKADNGAKIAEKCGEALEDIVKNVKKATDLTKEIKNASGEQSEGIAQVSNAVQQMDELTQRNAASAEETASASEEMSAQAQSLIEQVRILSAQVGSAGDGEALSHSDDPVGRTRARRSDTEREREESTRYVALANQQGRTRQSGRKNRLDTDGGNGEQLNTEVVLPLFSKRRNQTMAYYRNNIVKGYDNKKSIRVLTDTAETISACGKNIQKVAENIMMSCHLPGTKGEAYKDQLLARVDDLRKLVTLYDSASQRLVGTAGKLASGVPEEEVWDDMPV